MANEFEQVMARWADAFDRGDAAGCAALHTEDARGIPAHMPPVQGRSAITQLWQQLLDLKPEFNYDITETGSSGDQGYLIGSYGLKWNQEDGTPASENGTFLDIFKRQADGSWQFFVTMWSSDEPLPEA